MAVVAQGESYVTSVVKKKAGLQEIWLFWVLLSQVFDYVRQNYNNVDFVYIVSVLWIVPSLFSVCL
jgi:hypothetical protein